MKTANGQELRLIRGGHHFEMLLGAYRIVAAPKDKPPFPVDAEVAEEDTFLVLSADPKVREPDEHIVRVMTRLIETRPAAPGSVLVKGKRPLRLLAIVHDLNREPSWREEWVASALEGIFREAERRRLHSIALPFLGTLHGSLEKRRFVALLRNALERTAPDHLRRLWLIISFEVSRRVLEMIESELH